MELELDKKNIENKLLAVAIANEDEKVLKVPVHRYFLNAKYLKFFALSTKL